MGTSTLQDGERVTRFASVRKTISVRGNLKIICPKIKITAQQFKAVHSFVHATSKTFLGSALPIYAALLLLLFKTLVMQTDNTITIHLHGLMH